MVLSSYSALEVGACALFFCEIEREAATSVTLTLELPEIRPNAFRQGKIRRAHCSCTLFISPGQKSYFEGLPIACYLIDFFVLFLHSAERTRHAPPAERSKATLVWLERMTALSDARLIYIADASLGWHSVGANLVLSNLVFVGAQWTIGVPISL